MMDVPEKVMMFTILIIIAVGEIFVVQRVETLTDYFSFLHVEHTEERVNDRHKVSRTRKRMDSPSAEKEAVQKEAR